MHCRSSPHYSTLLTASSLRTFVLSGTLILVVPLFIAGCESGAGREPTALSAEAQEKQRELDALKLQAESGDVATMLLLAGKYYDGNGVESSRTEAASWFRMAAEAGNASAQFSTGVLYEQGHGFAPDKEQAIRWYAEAAEQNHTEAMNNLGLLLLEKEDPVFDTRAFRMFEGAAEAGILAAVCSLGRMKSQGRGTSQDFVSAAKDFRRAADEGLPAAQFYLAAAYQQGQGVPKDEAQAIKWLGASVDQGFALAQAQLGAILARGSDAAPRDPARAVTLLTAAADAGIPSAQRNLGLLYFKGLGVEEDLQAALVWYEISARLGDAAAKERRDLLRESMAESELAIVDSSVDAWFDEQATR